MDMDSKTVKSILSAVYSFLVQQKESNAAKMINAIAKNSLPKIDGAEDVIRSALYGKISQCTQANKKLLSMEEDSDTTSSDNSDDGSASARKRVPKAQIQHRANGHSSSVIKNSEKNQNESDDSDSSTDSSDEEQKSLTVAKNKIEKNSKQSKVAKAKKISIQTKESSESSDDESNDEELSSSQKKSSLGANNPQKPKTSESKDVPVNKKGQAQSQTNEESESETSSEEESDTFLTPIQSSVQTEHVVPPKSSLKSSNQKTIPAPRNMDKDTDSSETSSDSSIEPEDNNKKAASTSWLQKKKVSPQPTKNPVKMDVDSSSTSDSSEDCAKSLGNQNSKNSIKPSQKSPILTQKVNNQPPIISDCTESKSSALMPKSSNKKPIKGHGSVSAVPFSQSESSDSDSSGSDLQKESPAKSRLAKSESLKNAPISKNPITSTIKESQDSESDSSEDSEDSVPPKLSAKATQKQSLFDKIKNASNSAVKSVNKVMSSDTDNTSSSESDDASLQKKAKSENKNKYISQVKNVKASSSSNHQKAPLTKASPTVDSFKGITDSHSSKIGIKAKGGNDNPKISPISSKGHQICANKEDSDSDDSSSDSTTKTPVKEAQRKLKLPQTQSNIQLKNKDEKILGKKNKINDESTSSDSEHESDTSSASDGVNATTKQQTPSISKPAAISSASKQPVLPSKLLSESDSSSSSEDSDDDVSTKHQIIKTKPSSTKESFIDSAKKPVASKSASKTLAKVPQNKKATMNSSNVDTKSLQKKVQAVSTVSVAAPSTKNKKNSEKPVDYNSSSDSSSSDDNSSDVDDLYASKVSSSIIQKKNNGNPAKRALNDDSVRLDIPISDQADVNLKGKSISESQSESIIASAIFPKKQKNKTAVLTGPSKQSQESKTINVDKSVDTSTPVSHPTNLTSSTRKSKRKPIKNFVPTEATPIPTPDTNNEIAVQKNKSNKTSKMDSSHITQEEKGSVGGKENKRKKSADDTDSKVKPQNTADIEMEHKPMVKTTNKQNFRRISTAIEDIPEPLRDNAFKPRNSREFGSKAQSAFQNVQGKNFKREKNKRKRGNFSVGSIDTTPRSFKFD